MSARPFPSNITGCVGDYWRSNVCGVTCYYSRPGCKAVVAQESELGKSAVERGWERHYLGVRRESSAYAPGAFCLILSLIESRDEILLRCVYCRDLDFS